MKKYLIISLTLLLAILCGYICSAQTECNIYEKRPCNTEPIVYVPAKVARQIFVTNTWAYLGYENYSNFGYTAGLTGGVLNVSRYRNLWLFTNAFIGQGKAINEGMSAGIRSSLMYEYRRFLIGGGTGYGKTATAGWVKDNWRFNAGMGYLLDYPVASFKLLFNYVRSDDGSTSDGLEFDGIATFWQNKVALIPVIGYARSREGNLVVDGFYSQISIGIHI